MPERLPGVNLLPPAAETRYYNNILQNRMRKFKNNIYFNEFSSFLRLLRTAFRMLNIKSSIYFGELQTILR